MDERRETRRAGVSGPGESGRTDAGGGGGDLGTELSADQAAVPTLSCGSGVDGLVHGKVGKRSNHAKAARFRRRVLGLIGKHYGGEVGERFGPTLAAEHLAEDDGVVVDAETLRRWMLEEGLWSRARKRKPYRQRRLRRAHFGELVQIGRQLRGLAGSARTARLSDPHGGRCNQHEPGDVHVGRDNLGSRRDAARLGGEVRNTAGVVRGLEDSVSGASQRAAEAGRDCAGVASWGACARSWASS